MNKHNKKILAGTLAVGMLATGTFAWQSFSQEATNEVIEEVGPVGARFHDYFNGSNKDIFVENYTTDGTDVYARIRLEEYYEYGKNAGTANGTNITVVSGDMEGETPDFYDESTWDVYTFGSEASEDTESIRTYRTLEFGGGTTYLPTTNTDNEDNSPQLNGTYRDEYGDKRETPYEDYVDYAEESTSGSKETQTARVISMEDWKNEGAPVDDIWVYDTDGWAYYAAPIKSQTASGLLLTGIKQEANPTEEWYYAINVTAQLASAGDWGQAGDTSGMYEDGLSEDGLYVLNKAAGIATVRNMTIIHGDDSSVTGESLGAITAGSSISWAAQLDVLYVADTVVVDEDKTVTWTATAGTIDADTGDYTVPDSGTEVTITATSVLDTSQSTSITFTIG